MDLDGELRKLFNDDDRLDVHVSAKAEETIVRGAKRRRQRRNAVVGTFAVVALVGAGAGIIGLQHLPGANNMAGPLLSTSSSQPTPPPPSVSTHTETVIVTADPPIPGGNTTKGNNNTNKPPTGSSSTQTPPSEPGVYGKLKLAMSEADALKTGSLIEPTGEPNPDEKCKKYATQSVSQPDAVIISATRGIVRITLPNYAKTTKSVGAGSKIADVKAAYPTAAQNGSELVVQMNATPQWVYVFETDGTAVKTVRMRLAANDCEGA